jgi:uncharacterized membrane protein YjdF
MEEELYRQEIYKMILKKGQLPILITLILLIILFIFIAIQKQNQEFILYIGVIIFFFALIILTNHKTNFSNGILWGLTVWAFMHMAGGLINVGEGVLYGVILIEIIKTSNFTILRFDQLVHGFGFFLTTLIAYDLLKPYLNKKTNWKVIGTLLVLVGIGMGAINEIIEFITVISFPETGVGGYYNTLLDLIFNTIGAVIAVMWINYKRK